MKAFEGFSGRLRGKFSGRLRSRLATLALIFVAATTAAQPPDQKAVPEAEQGEGVSLTIYNGNFVVVRERRMMDIAKGRSNVRFRDVAATIVPETVQFTALGEPDAAKVVEQSYEFDLVSADKLLDKYIDQAIAVVTRDGGTLKGKLVSFDRDNLTLQTSIGVDVVPRQGNVQDVQLASLPTGLLLAPTLVWQVDAKRAGKQLVKVAYAADRMGWHVDYRARINQTWDKMNLAAWVTVNNETGTTFKDVQVKLMAGDVHLVSPGQPRARFSDPDANFPVLTGSTTLFIEKGVSEYHLYELQRKTTLTDHATKQIELFDIEDIPVTRKYVAAVGENRVAVVAEFKNSIATNKSLGIPLPKGPMRVFLTAADGAPEFIGQEEIDHTPKDEKVNVRIGYAFDLTVERKTVEQRGTKEKQYLDQEVRLRNHKKEAVAIEVIERIQGQRDGSVSNNSHPFVRRDVDTLVFTVEVPANGETVVTYTVRYGAANAMIYDKVSG